MCTFIASIQQAVIRWLRIVIYENKEGGIVEKTKGYVIKKLEDEYVLLPTGELAEQVNEVVSLSETAGFIYLHADQADSVEALAELVSQEYVVPKKEVLEDVQMVVKTLCARGVLYQGSLKNHSDHQ